MDINGLGSGLPADFSSFRAASQMRTMKMIGALLPSTSRSSSGMGLGQDIYDAVSKQTQGLYAGGRAAMNSANAVLGIDMNQSSSRKSATEEVVVETQDEVVAAPEPEKKTRNITDELLKAGGYVKPESDPYVVRTDFFA